MHPSIFLFVIVSYLVGSIPTGVVLAKLFSNRDIRKAGSGNIGATNVTRVLGKKLGMLTFAGDVAKGFLPVYAGESIFDSMVSVPALYWLVCAFGFAAFLGHIFPVYLKFKGGKGVATACGVFLCLEPVVIPIMLIIFLVPATVWRQVSPGSLIVASTLPIVLIGLSFVRPVSLPAILLSIVVGIFIIVRHRSNIKRMFQGKEHRMGSGQE
jgi:glycerol-3-phosphate acyltransferase PlsY